MLNILTVVNYALAGINVYLWTSGAIYGDINLGLAVFCFGTAQLCTSS
jgi:hypothetical protein